MMHNSILIKALDKIVEGAGPPDVIAKEALERHFQAIADETKEEK